MDIVLGVEVTRAKVVCGCYEKSGKSCRLMWVDESPVENSDVKLAVSSLKRKHALKKAKLHLSLPNEDIQQFVLGNVAMHGPHAYQRLVQAHLMQHGSQPFDELAYDYVRCAEDRLWVLAMPQAIVSDYMKWSRSLKLTLSELEPSLCGLLRLLPQNHENEFALLFIQDQCWEFLICNGVDVLFRQSRGFLEGDQGLIEWIEKCLAAHELNPMNIKPKVCFLFTQASNGYDIISHLKYPGLEVNWVNPNQFPVPSPEYLVTYGLAIKER